MNKKELRERFLALRRAISPERRREADAAICRNIRRLPCWRDAEHVALYASDGEEPDLGELPGEPGKRFYFPRYNAEEKQYESILQASLSGRSSGFSNRVRSSRPRRPAFWRRCCF